MKKTCETCNGSGQISYFKGVSRFLLSWEECPECAGLGYSEDQEKKFRKKSENSRPAGVKKKQKDRKKNGG